MSMRPPSTRKDARWRMRRAPVEKKDHRRDLVGRRRLVKRNPGSRSRRRTRMKVAIVLTTRAARWSIAVEAIHTSGSGRSRVGRRSLPFCGEEREAHLTGDGAGVEEAGVADAVDDDM